MALWRLLIFIWALCSPVPCVYGQAPKIKPESEFDLGITRLLRRAVNAEIKVSLLRRAKISDTLDLVVVNAFSGASIKLGIFLQDRAQAGLIYQLTLEEGRADCQERVSRLTPSEVILGCTRAQTGVGPNRKYIFNAGAKKLLQKLDYEPYTMLGIFPAGKNFVFIGSNTITPTAIEYAPTASTFRVLSKDQAMVWNARLQKARETGPSTEPAEDGSCRVSEGPNAGPCQLAGSRIWWGRSFYSGDGSGGFGWRDNKTQQTGWLTPPVMKDASVTAILPETNQVWLGLAHREPDATPPIGLLGLLRYDLVNRDTSISPIRDYINFMARSGQRLLLATDAGVTILEDVPKNNKARHYFVDQMPDGRLRVLEAN